MHPIELCLSSQQHGPDTYLLPDPNPVLASTRAAKLNGPMDHSVGGCICLFKFAGFKNDTTVKVAIAYMPIFWKKKKSASFALPSEAYVDAYPSMGPRIPSFSRSAAVSLHSCGSLETGTQTSVHDPSQGSRHVRPDGDMAKAAYQSNKPLNLHLPWPRWSNATSFSHPIAPAILRHPLQRPYPVLQTLMRWTLPIFAIRQE